MKALAVSTEIKNLEFDEITKYEENKGSLPEEAVNSMRESLAGVPDAKANLLSVALVPSFLENVSLTIRSVMEKRKEEGPSLAMTILMAKMKEETDLTYENMSRYYEGAIAFVAKKAEKAIVDSIGIKSGTIIVSVSDPDYIENFSDISLSDYFFMRDAELILQRKPAKETLDTKKYLEKLKKDTEERNIEHEKVMSSGDTDAIKKMLKKGLEDLLNESPN